MFLRHCNTRTPVRTRRPAHGLGAGGKDRLVGAGGKDRLVGGGARDKLVGNAGGDVIKAKDGVRGVVRCGSGSDRVVADRFDRISGDCELVRRSR